MKERDRFCILIIIISSSFVLKMQNFRELNSFSNCRLCAAGGPHEIDIWDGVARSTEVAMSEKIFVCVGLQVQKSDKWLWP